MPDAAIYDKDAKITHIALRWDEDGELWVMLGVGLSEEEITEVVTRWASKGIEGARVFVVT